MYKNETEQEELIVSDFKIEKVIGEGHLGKVFLVTKKGTGKPYAMKTLSKDKMIKFDLLESALLEKDILSFEDHPFLVGMNFIIHTERSIYFVMKFMRGGNLSTHLKKANRFTEEHTRFYIMQVALALGHLHS